jgi:hypothetical protein
MPRKQSNAKADSISKSQAVRNYLADHPNATAKEIRPAIKAAHGLDVTPQMINTLKSNFRKQQGRRGRKAGPKGQRGRARTNGAGITVDELLAVKKLAQDLGGIRRAQEALAALSRLT